MIKKLVSLKPSKDKLNLYVSVGFLFFIIGVYDLISNSFFGINITAFLPKILSYFTPLIFGNLFILLILSFIRFL